MELERLSRLLRAPGIDWVVALLAALVVGGTLLLAAYDFSPVRFYEHRAPVVPLLIIGAVCGAFAWAGVRTWRRLWRRGRTPLEQVTYDYGVRKVGIFLVSASPLIGIAVALGVASSRGGASPLTILAIALLAVPVALPIALWLGYFLGWKRAATLGQLSHQLAKGDDPLPPPI